MKKSKGITLIALVITVIILLILAGVAVSIGLNGDNVFEKANEAKTGWNEKVAEEDAKIKEIWGMIDSKDEVKQVNDANPGTLEGSGTEANPYTINSIEDLVAFAYNVNKGDTEYGLYSGKTVALGLDLDIQNDKSYANPNAKYVLDDYGYKTDESGTAIKTLLTDTNGIGFVPIGNERGDGFAGTFDGQNHAIANLYENVNIYGGLFGNAKNAVIIRNLEVRAGKITAIQTPCGAIIGNAQSTLTIINCLNTGTISSVSAPAGGIVGWANSTAEISNCYNTGDVTSTNSNSGGICGGTGTKTKIEITSCYNRGNVHGKGPAGGILANDISSTGTATITDCYNTGNVTSTDNPTGGMLGLASSKATITNCYNTGNVISTNYLAGGILGYATSTATIMNCYNTGDAISTGSSAGGMIGNASKATITNCYNTGDIQGTAQVGGMIGNVSTATITNCYNTGDIQGITLVGGMIGDAQSTATITNCYNTGDISSTDQKAGGILGAGNSSNKATISYCYNTGNITGTYPVGGIAGAFATITQSHNTGTVASTNSSLVGEIIGQSNSGSSEQIVGEGCTYGTGVAAGTMDMSNFVTRMNEYVTTNNSNPSHTPLKTWKLENGYPVFVN